MKQSNLWKVGLDSYKPEAGSFLSARSQKHKIAPIKEKILFVIQEPNEAYLQSIVAPLELVQRKTEIDGLKFS